MPVDGPVFSWMALFSMDSPVFYGVTQRGNNSQWVFKDEEDFLKALSLMDRYSEIHEVKVHGYSLMHNHLEDGVTKGSPAFLKCRSEQPAAEHPNVAGCLVDVAERVHPADDCEPRQPLEQWLTIPGNNRGTPRAG